MFFLWNLSCKSKLELGSSEELCLIPQHLFSILNNNYELYCTRPDILHWSSQKFLYSGLPTTVITFKNLLHLSLCSHLQYRYKPQTPLIMLL